MGNPSMPIIIGNALISGSNVKTKILPSGQIIVQANKATIFPVDANKRMNVILKGDNNMFFGSDKSDTVEVHGDNNTIAPANSADTVKVYGEHNTTKDHYNDTNYQSFTSGGKKQPEDPYKNTNKFRSPVKIQKSI